MDDRSGFFRNLHTFRDAGLPLENLAIFLDAQFETAEKF